MKITCPKCRHITGSIDDRELPVASCPACGIYYAKYKPNPAPTAKQKPVRAPWRPSRRLKRLGILLVAALPAWLALSAAVNVYKVAGVKDQVRAMLKDPESAIFQSVIVATSRSGAGCGLVNAKNGMGGYVGFKQFVALKNGAVYLEQSEGFPVDELSFLNDQMKLITMMLEHCTENPT